MIINIHNYFWKCFTYCLLLEPSSQDAWSAHISLSNLAAEYQSDFKSLWGKKTKPKLYFLSLPQYPTEPPDCLVDFPVQFAISWMPQVNCHTMHLFLLTEIHMQYVGGNKESDFLTLAFFPVCILFLYMLT